MPPPSPVLPAVLTALSLSMIALSPFLASASPSPYRQGVAAFESGDDATARVALAGVDARTEPHAVYLLGVLAERRKAYAEAVIRFTSYLASVPAGSDLVPSARAHQAYCLAAGGRYAMAASLLAASGSRPTDRATTLLLGYADLILCRRQADAPGRRAAAARAEARFGAVPNDAEALNGRGLARLALARPREAAEDFHRAGALAPRVTFFMNEGQARQEAKEFAAARTAYRRAADLAPESDPLHAKAMRALGHLTDLEATGTK